MDNTENHNNAHGWDKLADHLFLRGHPFYELMSCPVEDLKPPKALIKGFLYRGMHHHLFAGAGVGKSWIAMKASKNVARNGGRVLYIDFENGEKVVENRMASLGMDEISLSYFKAVDGDKLKLADGLEAIAPGEDVDLIRSGGYIKFRRLVATRPALIVWDSWAAALEACGFDENSNTDVQTWCRLFLEPAKKLGTASLVVDHTSHNNNHRAIGGVRKKNEMDVQWRVVGSPSFDRKTTDFVPLKLEKDRHGCMLKAITFECGGTPFVHTVHEEDVREKRNNTARKVKSTTKEKILEDLRNNGAGTCYEISDRAELNLKSVKNNVTEMLKEESLSKVGEKDGLMVVDLNN